MGFFKCCVSDKMKLELNLEAMVLIILSLLYWDVNKTIRQHHYNKNSVQRNSFVFLTVRFFHSHLCLYLNSHSSHHLRRQRPHPSEVLRRHQHLHLPRLLSNTSPSFLRRLPLVALSPEKMGAVDLSASASISMLKFLS